MDANDNIDVTWEDQATDQFARYFPNPSLLSPAVAAVNDPTQRWAPEAEQDSLAVSPDLTIHLAWTWVANYALPVVGYTRSSDGGGNFAAWRILVWHTCVQPFRKGMN